MWHQHIPGIKWQILPLSGECDRFSFSHWCIYFFLHLSSRSLVLCHASYRSLYLSCSVMCVWLWSEQNIQSVCLWGCECEREKVRLSYQTLHTGVKRGWTNAWQMKELLGLELPVCFKVLLCPFEQIELLVMAWHHGRTNWICYIVKVFFLSLEVTDPICTN